MTDPTPLNEIVLDSLLGRIDAPEISQDFADRVLAEAARAHREPTVPPLPPRVRAGRRPWTRRGVWAGVIAINLMVASAVAATLTGVAPRFTHVVAVAAHVLHIHRHEATPRHVNPPPIGRLARAAPFLEPPPVRPASIARPSPRPRTAMIGPQWERVHPRPEIRRDRHPPFTSRMTRPGERRWQGRDHATHLNAARPARRGMSPMAQNQFGPRGFDRGPWAGQMHRPWAQGWNGPRQQEMGPRWRRGQGGWRRPGRGGGRGMGWRRPFGRGRRF